MRSENDSQGRLVNLVLGDVRRRHRVNPHGLRTGAQLQYGGLNVPISVGHVTRRAGIRQRGSYVFPHIESPWSLIIFVTVCAFSLPANSSCMFGATALLKMSVQAVFTGSRTT